MHVLPPVLLPVLVLLHMHIWGALAAVWNHTAHAYGRIEDLGLNLRYVDGLPTGWLGAYNDNDGEILVHRKLLAVPDAHCTVLWHELGHAEYGHDGSEEIQELIADAYAAKRLIRLDDWMEAQRVAPDPDDDAAIAKLLGVLPWVVKLYRQGMNGSLRPTTRALIIPDPGARSHHGVCCPVGGTWN